MRATKSALSILIGAVMVAVVATFAYVVIRIQTAVPAQQAATPAIASVAATQRSSPLPPSTSQPSQTVVGPTRTPTPKPDEIRTPPPFAPTFTPYPVTEVTDLAPELAAGDKATAFVQHPDGTFQKILFKYNTDPKDLPLRPSDVLVQIVPPASIIGHFALTPFVLSSTATSTLQPYPGPATRIP